MQKQQRAGARPPK